MAAIFGTDIKAAAEECTDGLGAEADMSARQRREEYMQALSILSPVTGLSHIVVTMYLSTGLDTRYYIAPTDW